MLCIFMLDTLGATILRCIPIGLNRSIVTNLFELLRYTTQNVPAIAGTFGWYLRDSNQGHADFQSTALPLS